MCQGEETGTRLDMALTPQLGHECHKVTILSWIAELWNQTPRLPS